MRLYASLALAGMLGLAIPNTGRPCASQPQPHCAAMKAPPCCCDGTTLRADACNCLERAPRSPAPFELSAAAPTLSRPLPGTAAVLASAEAPEAADLRRILVARQMAPPGVATERLLATRLLC